MRTSPQRSGLSLDSNGIPMDSLTLDPFGIEHLDRFPDDDGRTRKIGSGVQGALEASIEGEMDMAGLSLALNSILLALWFKSSIFRTVAWTGKSCARSCASAPASRAI